MGETEGPGRTARGRTARLSPGSVLVTWTAIQRTFRSPTPRISPLPGRAQHCCCDSLGKVAPPRHPDSQRTQASHRKVSLSSLTLPLHGRCVRHCCHKKGSAKTPSSPVTVAQPAQPVAPPPGPLTSPPAPAGTGAILPRHRATPPRRAAHSLYTCSPIASPLDSPARPAHPWAQSTPHVDSQRHCPPNATYSHAPPTTAAIPGKPCQVRRALILPPHRPTTPLCTPNPSHAAHSAAHSQLCRRSAVLVRPALVALCRPGARSDPMRSP